jgi:hypothetical protein
MMHRATYRFFDAAFVVESDTPAFLAQFDRTYGPLRATAADDAPVYRVSLGGGPTLTIDGQTIRSDDARALSRYAYNAIINAALARVRSHLLFHAAALSAPDGQGIILAGHAGQGKTTLTLTLLDRGYGFLSDDVAAVGRANGQLYPFPRRPGIRLPSDRPGQKHIVDIDEIASPCPARLLFILTGPAAVADEGPWYLVLDRVEEKLLTDLRALDGVRRARIARVAPYPTVRLELTPGSLATVEAEITEACQRQGALVFDIARDRRTPSSAQEEPHLKRLSPVQAGWELLSHMKGGPRSALLQGVFAGSAARLYLALTALTSSMTCHRLSIGSLEGMIAAIAGAAAHEQPQL